MGHFRKIEHTKVGHFEKTQARKEPKMNMFDFGAFQEKLHMLSREKYLLQKLFGAFQDTPRN